MDRQGRALRAGELASSEAGMRHWARHVFPGRPSRRRLQGWNTVRSAAASGPGRLHSAACRGRAGGRPAEARRQRVGCAAQRQRMLLPSAASMDARHAQCRDKSSRGQAKDPGCRRPVPLELGHRGCALLWWAPWRGRGIPRGRANPPTCRCLPSRCGSSSISVWRHAGRAPAPPPSTVDRERPSGRANARPAWHRSAAMARRASTSAPSALRSGRVDAWRSNRGS